MIIFINILRNNLLKKIMSKAPQFAHQEMIDSKKMGIIDQQDTEVAVIKFADMSERMQQHAVDCCQFAFQ